MEGPPVLPAMIDYAHDERTSPPPEKNRPSISAEEWQPQVEAQPQPQSLPHSNPLKGKSLGVFAPDNWIRLRLCEMLVHPVTEPTILILIVLQTILLAVDAARPEKYNAAPQVWQSSWIDIGLLVLFIIYSVEIVARIIVSGFVKNAKEYSTVDRNEGLRAAFAGRVRTFFAPHGQSSTQSTAKEALPEPSIIRSFTNVQAQADIPGHSRQQQRMRLARRAFLRHGFNRLDFLAVVSFWISCVMKIVMIQPSRHIYIFQMLSCLRILRLLGLTSGTSVGFSSDPC